MRIINPVLVFIASIVLSTSCGSLSTAEIDADKPLTLEVKRSACFGMCPVYDLKVAADGVVKFEGQEHTAVKTAEDRVSPQQLKELAIAIKKADFFNLEDHYTGTNCPTIVTDSPTVTLSVSQGNASKTIVHYLGCLTDIESRYHPDNIYPPALFTLEERIDEILQVSRWTKS